MPPNDTTQGASGTEDEKPTGPQLSTFTNPDGSEIYVNPTSVDAIHSNVGGGTRIQVNSVAHDVKEGIDDVIFAIEDGLKLWGEFGKL